MGAFKELQKKLKAFSLNNEISDILQGQAQLLADIVRDQLFRGRNADGNYISPRYSQDSYFKSREKALAYAHWKQMITPDPDRPEDVPNIYIDGTYHKGITVRVSKNWIEYTNRANNARSIEAHYGGDEYLYGLTPDSRLHVKAAIIKTPLVRRLQLKVFR